MSKKAWIIFAAACVALLAGLVYMQNQNKPDISNVDTMKIQEASDISGNIGEHVFGKKDSKVVLIEYGDFQCPGCAQAFPNLKAVKEKYEDQLAFVFRNFPLTSIHPNARAAAAAAEAAGLQGKYWEMHDTLYANQNSWKDLDPNKRADYFAEMANSIGLNANKFKDDMTSEKVNQKISFDMELGKKVGVTGTPSVYLNGENLGSNIWNNEEALDKKVAEVLKENGIKLPK